MKRLTFLFVILLCLTGADLQRRRRTTQEFDPSTISGITMWLDASDLSTITADAQRRVSQWDSKVGSISFTQATDADKPVRTVGGQGENLNLHSEDQTNAVYDVATWPVSVSGDTVTATAGVGRHGVRQTITTVAGETYACRWDVEYGNYQYLVFGDDGDAAWHVAVADMTGGSITSTTNLVSSSITNVSGNRYIIEASFTRTNGGNTRCFACFGSGSSDASCPTINPGGTETYKIYSIQARRANTSPAYVATTDHAIRAGSPSGKSGIWFDDINHFMASGSLLSDTFGAGAKTAFAVFSPDDVSQNSYVLTDRTNVKWAGPVINGSVAAFRCYNDDGGADFTDSSALASGSVYVAGCGHDGTNLHYFGGNDNSSTASGNTSDITGALELGYDAGGHNMGGTLYEVVTYNKFLGSGDRARVRDYLCKKWGADC